MEKNNNIMTENTELILKDNSEIVENAEEIQNLIYVIRGKQVMLDSDLAMLYKVETKVFNQSVKRHLNRFPDSFRFQLTEYEYESLRSHIVTSNKKGGRRYLPFAFTEQGIAMLSAVLHSDAAVRISIRIMETFIEMRKYLANNSLLLEKINGLEAHQIEIDLRNSAFEKSTNERFEQVFNYIESHKESNQKIFFDGQIFDAFSLMTGLVRQANQEIILIDGYVDVTTLNIFTKKKPEVNVTLYTLPNARLTAQDIANFNAQYPRLNVRHTSVFHDRFMIIDGTCAYHIGASIKDAGKKCFAINKIADISVINDIIQKARENIGNK